jgi:hypothetical protein
MDYCLDAREPTTQSGAEVWSMVYLDKHSGEVFYHEHHKKLEMPPEDEG